MFSFRLMGLLALVVPGLLTASDEAFLAGMRANPEDDTLRLVYADWLDEHGDYARAEFIRVQIERSKTSPGLQWQTLYNRELALLAANWDQWNPALGRNPRFRRGFVEQVEVGAMRHVFSADFLQKVNPPVITHLHVEADKRFGVRPWQQLWEHPSLSHLRDLVVDRLSGTNPEGAGDLVLGFARAKGPRLRGLDIRFRLYDVTLKELVASQNVAELKSLRLMLTESNASVLASSSVEGIRDLTLYDDSSHPREVDLIAVVRTLANAKAFAGIESLTVNVQHGTPLHGDGLLGDQILHQIAQSKFLRGLRVLRIMSSGSSNSSLVSDEGLKMLASSPHFAALEEFAAQDSWVTHRGIAALATAPALRLKSLTLRPSRSPSIGDEGIRAISASPGFSRLELLSLQGFGITDDNAVVLANASTLSALRVLDLGNGNVPGPAATNRIEARGVAALLNSPHLSGLNRLNLGFAVASPLAGLRLTEIRPHLAELNLTALSSQHELDAEVRAWFRQHGASRFPNLVDFRFRGVGGLQNREYIVGDSPRCPDFLLNYVDSF